MFFKMFVSIVALIMAFVIVPFASHADVLCQHKMPSETAQKISAEMVMTDSDCHENMTTSQTKSENQKTQKDDCCGSNCDCQSCAKVSMVLPVIHKLFHQGIHFTSNQFRFFQSITLAHFDPPPISFS